VIVFEDSTPVEIQIRTKVQDAWAQITEKAGDRWGRGLRYGEPLEGLDARQLVKALGGLSNVLDTFERLELQAQQLRTGAQQNQQLTTRIDRIDTLVTKAKENLLAEVKALEGAE
jgi:ppGpp synthetase/RelA/SpoT-type nucleotidyltranferase